MSELFVCHESEFRYLKTNALDSNVEGWKYSNTLNMAAIWGDNTVAGNQHTHKSCLGRSSISWHSQKSRPTLWMPLISMTTKVSPGADLGLMQLSPREWPSCIWSLICLRVMDEKKVPVYSCEDDIFSKIDIDNGIIYSPLYDAEGFMHAPPPHISNRTFVLLTPDQPAFQSIMPTQFTLTPMTIQP